MTLSSRRQESFDGPAIDRPLSSEIDTGSLCEIESGFARFRMTSESGMAVAVLSPVAYLAPSNAKLSCRRDDEVIPTDDEVIPRESWESF